MRIALLIPRNGSLTHNILAGKTFHPFFPNQNPFCHFLRVDQLFFTFNKKNELATDPIDDLTRSDVVQLAKAVLR